MRLFAFTMLGEAGRLGQDALHLLQLFRVPLRGLEFAAKLHPRCGLAAAPLVCGGVLLFQHDRWLENAEEWHLRGRAAVVKPYGSGTTGVDAGSQCQIRG